MVYLNQGKERKKFLKRKERESHHGRLCKILDQQLIQQRGLCRPAERQRCRGQGSGRRRGAQPHSFQQYQQLRFAALDVHEQEVHQQRVPHHQSKQGGMSMLAVLFSTLVGIKVYQMVKAMENTKSNKWVMPAVETYLLIGVLTQIV